MAQSKLLSQPPPPPPTQEPSSHISPSSQSLLSVHSPAPPSQRPISRPSGTLHRPLAHWLSCRHVPSGKSAQARSAGEQNWSIGQSLVASHSPPPGVPASVPGVCPAS